MPKLPAAKTPAQLKREEQDRHALESQAAYFRLKAEAKEAMKRKAELGIEVAPNDEDLK